MMLGRDAIAGRVPHAGAMLLLDEVVAWDAESIVCRTTSHRQLDNPLRYGHMLPALAGIEYAAQAMALHGALTAPVQETAPRSGLLAALRDVTLHVTRLDDAESPMIVSARRMAADGGRAIYSFAVEAAGRSLLNGRATVVVSSEVRK